MTTAPLELADIQGGVLRGLPTPYVGVLDVLRIDDAADGRTFLQKAIPWVNNAMAPTGPDADAWCTVGFSYRGLQALGVGKDSLASFAPEFQQGMAARADRLHDVGESAPQNWEYPFGTPDVHVALTVIAPGQERLNTLLEYIEATGEGIPGVTRIYRQEIRSSDGREAFGYRANISQPPVEGSAVPGSNKLEEPIKAGEFVLGYPNEAGQIPLQPAPEVLGRNGSYMAVRKLEQRVDLFNRYLHEHSDGMGEEFLAAKIMGRWRSGAPLVLSPDLDDPELGADPALNNTFAYNAEDDARGFKCPLGSHMRRMNPRDSDVFGNPRRHRLIRREAAYGPPTSGDVSSTDGERGMIFAAVCASLRGQFEFVQEEWVNSGIFIGRGDERDPLVGANDGSGVFTIPERPIRRRVDKLPSFVVTRGGEYFFVPSITALRWLAEHRG